MSTSRSNQTTIKLYLSESDKFEHQTTVTSIEPQDGGFLVKLTETIFHPQGGGQPSDIGTIGNVPVDSVVKIGDAFDFDVGHFVKYDKLLPFAVGDTVNITVDPERRKLLSRLHTAGHLISNHVQILFGFPYQKCHLYPEKGIFLVFSNPSDTTPLVDKPKEADISDLTKACNTDVQSDLPITEVVLDGADAGKRGIKIGDYSAFPCAGTHVRLSEVGSIFVDKFKRDKNGLKINYHLSDQVEPTDEPVEKP